MYRLFSDGQEHVFSNLLLFWWAIVLALVANLNGLKAYLRQLLDTNQTRAGSHYRTANRAGSLDSQGPIAG